MVAAVAVAEADEEQDVVADVDLAEVEAVAAEADEVVAEELAEADVEAEVEAEGVDEVA